MTILTFRVGVVVGVENQTIKVACRRAYKHPKYGKLRIKVTKCLVHDQHCSAKVDDKVRIRQTRPKSLNKHWVLEEILN